MANDEILTFNRDSMRQIAEEVFRSKRSEISNMVRQEATRSQPSEPDYDVPFFNTTNETIPPYAVMEVVDPRYETARDSFLSGRNKPLIYVRKPTARRDGLWLVNRQWPVPAQSTGRGTWATEPTLCLFEGALADYNASSTPSGNYETRYTHSPSSAPQPGYWHLAGYGHYFNSIEDLGFDMLPGHRGRTLQDYYYHHPHTELNYITAWYFVQRFEPQENSILIPLSSTVRTQVDGEVDDEIDEWDATTGTYYSLKPRYAEDVRTSRVGVDILASESTLRPFRIFRNGNYKIELKITLNHDAYSTFYSDTPVKEDGINHAHYTYDKFNNPNPGTINVNLSVATPSGNFIVGMSDPYGTNIVSSHPIPLSTTCNQTIETTLEEFPVGMSGGDSDYDPDSQFIEFGVWLSGSRVGSGGDYPMSRISDAEPGNENRLPGGAWLKITRLRNAATISEEIAAE